MTEVEIPLYSRVEDNKFSPLVITKGQIAGLKELAKDKKIPDIVNKRILKYNWSNEKRHEQIKIK